MRRYRRADIAMQGMPGRERVGLDKTRHFMRHGTSARGRRHKPTAGGFVCKNRLPQVAVSTKITKFPKSQKNFQTHTSILYPDPKSTTQQPIFQPNKIYYLSTTYHHIINPNNNQNINQKHQKTLTIHSLPGHQETRESRDNLRKTYGKATPMNSEKLRKSYGKATP